MHRTYRIARFSLRVSTGLSLSLGLAACTVLAAPAALQAQVTSARLSGSVLDASGAAVAGAQVKATSTATNLTQNVTADGAGNYAFASLPPGPYTVTVDASGFQESVDTGIVLTVGQSASLNITVKVGQATESTTVNAAAEIINTSTAEISQVIDENSVKELPLNGRDPSSLVFLSAGVTNELQSQASTLPGGNSFPTESGASAGGGRQGSTWYLLDGVSNMDTFALLAAPFPNADATQEFRVITNNFDARYGFAPSAVVSIQTKSGTNQFHGGAFEFIRNNVLNASNYFTGAVDQLKRNQFGGYVGGPILHDRLFFFTNYQGTRNHYASSSNPVYTPTAAMIAGDFSAVPASNLTGPLASSVFNPGTQQVNPAKFSPGALAILKSVPLGQVASTGLTNVSNPAAQESYNENTSRLDYTINDKQRVFVRSFLYNYNLPGATTPGNILVGVTGKNGTYLNLVVGHTWTITPTLLNSATASWAELNFSTGTVEPDASGNPVCLSEYITVNDPAGSCYISGLSAFSGNVLYGGGLGFNAFSGSPNDTHRRYWQFSDTVTKSVGKHTITAGTDILHRYGSELYGGAQNAAITANGQYTGFPLLDYLLGYSSSFSQGAGESGSEQGWMIGLYGQDQYKLRNNVTVTAGLRWDPNLALAIKNGRGAAFVPGQQSTRYPNAPAGLVYPGDKGIGDGLMPTTYGYFEPRIGIAWQPRPMTAVRAGFGLFTTPLEDAFYDKAWDAAPFAPSYQLNGVYTANPVAGTPLAQQEAPLNFDTPWSTLASTGGKSPFPPFASPGTVPASNVSFGAFAPISLPGVFASNFKLGITQSWNLSVEQQFTNKLAMHIAYVASESYHQATTVEQNPGIYANGGNRTTYPNFSSVLQVQDGATASYESLQAGFEERMSHGLQLQSNFTFSHSTDVGGSGDPQFESSVSDPFNIGHDKGPSSLNYPFVWVTNGIYEAPKLRGHNALVKNTLGGWEVSALYTFQSGPPFTINGGNGNNNSGFQVGQDRADVTGQPINVRAGSKKQWINQYFNTAAFTQNAAGTPGDSKKFLLQEAPIATMDAAVMKNWEYRERYKLQFRWEAFNALNHPSFGQPDSNPTDSNFGQITGIGAIAPRVMQGALKLTF
jgi:hypothetical protein